MKTGPLAHSHTQAQAKNVIPQTRRAAVHEAGHAVFAVLTRTPFHHVILNPTGGGHLLHRDDSSGDELRWVPSRDQVCDVIIALAGEMAERFILGDCMDSGLVRDRDMIKNAMCDLAHTADHQARIEQRCRCAVQALFRIPAIRAATEQVAENLERRGKLISKEVEELVSAEARQAYEAFPDIETT